MNKHTARHINGHFVPLLIDTIDSPAWRVMSHGAKMLYIALKRRYNATIKNNGRIFLSQRDASRELISHTDQIARWFRELQHYGFIVVTAAGCLGVEGRGKAPHWRLTELDWNGKPAGREFALWNGEHFANKKQKPVPESRHTPYRKTGKPPYRKTGTLVEPHVQENQDISAVEMYRKTGS